MQEFCFMKKKYKILCFYYNWMAVKSILHSLFTFNNLGSYIEDQCINDAKQQIKRICECLDIESYLIDGIIINTSVVYDLFMYGKNKADDSYIIKRIKYKIWNDTKNSPNNMDTHDLGFAISVLITQLHSETGYIAKFEYSFLDQITSGNELFITSKMAYGNKWSYIYDLFRFQTVESKTVGINIFKMNNILYLSPIKDESISCPLRDLIHYNLKEWNKINIWSLPKILIICIIRIINEKKYSNNFIVPLNLDINEFKHESYEQDNTIYKLKSVIYRFGEGIDDALFKSYSNTTGNLWNNSNDETIIEKTSFENIGNGTPNILFYERVI